MVAANGPQFGPSSIITCGQAPHVWLFQGTEFWKKSWLVYVWLHTLRTRREFSLSFVRGPISPSRPPLLEEEKAIIPPSRCPPPHLPKGVDGEWNEMSAGQRERESVCVCEREREGWRVLQRLFRSKMRLRSAPKTRQESEKKRGEEFPPLLRPTLRNELVNFFFLFFSFFFKWSLIETGSFLFCSLFPQFIFF